MKGMLKEKLGCAPGRFFKIAALLFMCFLFFSATCMAAGQAIPDDPVWGGQEKGSASHNAIYDRLKRRLEQSYEEGMNKTDAAEPIEITGSLPERLLRGIADRLNRNLKSIKAGAVIIGMCSFVMGSALAILAKKDKKIRKQAVLIGMMAIPGLLLIAVFGISLYVSMFL